MFCLDCIYASSSTICHLKSAFMHFFHFKMSSDIFLNSKSKYGIINVRTAAVLSLYTRDCKKMDDTSPLPQTV